MEILLLVWFFYHVFKGSMSNGKKKRGYGASWQDGAWFHDHGQKM